MVNEPSVFEPLKFYCICTLCICFVNIFDLFMNVQYVQFTVVQFCTKFFMLTLTACMYVCIARQKQVFFLSVSLALVKACVRLAPSLMILYEILCIFYKISTATTNAPDMKKLTGGCLLSGRFD